MARKVVLVQPQPSRFKIMYKQVNNNQIDVNFCHDIALQSEFKLEKMGFRNLKKKLENIFFEKFKDFFIKKKIDWTDLFLPLLPSWSPLREPPQPPLLYSPLNPPRKPPQPRMLLQLPPWNPARLIITSGSCLQYKCLCQGTAGSTTCVGILQKKIREISSFFLFSFESKSERNYFFDFCPKDLK